MMTDRSKNNKISTTSGKHRRRSRTFQGLQNSTDLFFEEGPFIDPQNNSRKRTSRHITGRTASTKYQSAGSDHDVTHNKQPFLSRSSEGSSYAWSSHNSSGGSTMSKNSATYRKRYSTKKRTGKLREECLETKRDMLEIIKDDLALKLELRSIQEQFLDLLTKFEAFESRHVDVVESTSQASRSSEGLRQRKRYKVTFPKHPKTPRTEFSFNKNVIIPQRKASQKKLDQTSMLSTAHQDLNDISKISAAQQTFSDILQNTVSTPLQSTMNYPQSSTPERTKADNTNIDLSLIPPSELASINSVTKNNSEIESPFDSGANTPVAVPAFPVKTWKGLLNDTPRASSTESTPVVCRSLLENHQSMDSSLKFDASTVLLSGSLDNMESPPQLVAVGATSASSEAGSANSSGSKMKRQAGQPALYDLRDPVGLSETDMQMTTTFLSDTTQLGMHSNEATRGSLPDASKLSSLNSELGPPLSDASDRCLTYIMSNQESSYKESDDAGSPPHIFNLMTPFAHPSARRKSCQGRRQISQVSSSTNSSTQSGDKQAEIIYQNQHMLAPLNTPDTSSSSRDRCNIDDGQRQADELYFLSSTGMRPPCIGEENECPPTVIKKRPPRSNPRRRSRYSTQNKAPPTWKLNHEKQVHYIRSEGDEGTTTESSIYEEIPENHFYHQLEVVPELITSKSNESPSISHNEHFDIDVYNQGVDSKLLKRNATKRRLSRKIKTFFKGSFKSKSDSETFV